MQSQPRLLTTARQRQRLALWALTMLSWIAAVLFAGRDVTRRQLRQRYRRLSLQRLTRMALHLIVIRAGELGRWRTRRRLCFCSRGRDLRVRHLMRSLVGSNLRRALKRKQLRERIEALRYVLSHLDMFACALARRRLTRLRAIKPALTPAAPLATLVTSLPALADSS
jgi:hypothetical protein